MGRGVFAATAAVVLVGTVLGAAAGAMPREAAEVPASVAPARIYVRASGGTVPAEGHTFSFYVLLDTCPAPLLELDHTRVVERPKTRVHVGAAIVTAYLRHPAHAESETPCPPEVPDMKLVQVKTKRPAASLAFFDGSSSPPRRVWPRTRSARGATRQQARTCGPAEGKTLASGRRVRVYTVNRLERAAHHPFEVPLVFGCLNPRGHPRLLGSPSSSFSRYKGHLVGLLHTETLAIDAPWVAYASSATVVDAPGIGVTAVNLRTNTRRGCNVGGGPVTLAQPSVADVVVTRGGAIAWAGDARPERNFYEPMVNVVARCHASTWI